MFKCSKNLYIFRNCTSFYLSLALGLVKTLKEMEFKRERRKEIIVEEAQSALKEPRGIINSQQI